MLSEYINKGIKELITQYPKISQLLDKYGIGCVTCSIGTCKLKDIVSIHNLTTKKESQLMSEIAVIIFPDQKIVIPEPIKKITSASGSTSLELRYSPPLKILVNEHRLIKRLLTLIPTLLAKLNLTLPAADQPILQATDFIRNYADKFHHAKEEDILFKYFDKNLDILQVMETDHKTGREFVGKIIEGVKEQDSAKVRQNLLAYEKLLQEHIQKEDEILYPWMDRQLSDKQVGELYQKFLMLEKDDLKNKYQEVICNLEKKYLKATK